MMSRYSPTELGGKGLFLRLYLQARGIDAAPRILPVAGRGLGDKDADALLTRMTYCTVSENLVVATAPVLAPWTSSAR